MKYFNLLIISIIFYSVASCEKEIELDEDQIKPRIVVNSIFSANDTLWINLSESRDILYTNNGTSFNGKLPAITDATAQLLDNNNNVLANFTHTLNGDYYVASPLPVAGNTYKIEAQHPNFDNVSSQSYTPSIVSILSMDTIRLGDRFNIDVVINDDPAEANYYSISIMSQITDTYEIEPGVFETNTNRYFEWICSKDINIVGSSSDETGDNCSRELIFSDKTFNGENYNFKVKTFIYNQVDSYIVVLKSISEDLYKYNSSINKYNQTTDNPFGEPVQVYSNIENGFGVFGGYSEYKDSIIFQP